MFPIYFEIVFKNISKDWITALNFLYLQDLLFVFLPEKN